MSSNKLVIFNVGGAFSAFGEIGGTRILVDLGKSTTFSPVTDFLLPYAKAEKWEPSTLSGANGKLHLDQMIISHPHKDHIADIQPLWNHFYPQFATLANDNEGMDESDKIHWREITTPDDPDVLFIRQAVLEGRIPPLVSSTIGLEIFYLPAKHNEKELPSCDYTNNLSLICIMQIGLHRVVLPGDIMPSGMEALLKTGGKWIKKDSNDAQVKTFERAISKKDVDILIAPHHGLKSSFSTDFMNKMEKLGLVIIPEKIQYSESNREVDPRYYSSSSGLDIYDLDTGKTFNQKGIKTSGGHMIIAPSGIYVTKDKSTLLKTFISL